MRKTIGNSEKKLWSQAQHTQTLQHEHERHKIEITSHDGLKILVHAVCLY